MALAELPSPRPGAPPPGGALVLLTLSLAATGLLAACQDYAFEPLEEEIHADDEAGSVHEEPLESSTVIRYCPGPLELADAVASDETCAHEIVTGTLDHVVEWSLDSFKSKGEYSEVVMAPVVGQLTDDDGDGELDEDDDPDIVVVADDGGANELRRGILRVLSGRDGTQELFFEGASHTAADGTELDVYAYRYSNVALGDIDGDGRAEIVFVAQVLSSGGGDGGGSSGGPGGEDTAVPGSDTGDPGGSGSGEDGGDNPIDPELPGDPPSPPPPSPAAPGPAPPTSSIGPADLVCTVAAIEIDGSVDWAAHQFTFDCGGHAPVLGDLEGDGTVEVAVGPHVFEGETGALRFSGEAGQGTAGAYAEQGLHSIMMDLDGDGEQVLVAGPTLYTPEGAVRCTAEAPPEDGFTAAADLDLDGVGEVVLVGGGAVAIYEADCSVVRRWSLVGGGSGGPPTVGDFDGDGEPEIGIAEAETYTVYEVDGSARWSREVDDESSHATGSVVFDFEGDGRAEVVYADETRLWVFSGVDGAVRLESTLHASRTLHEYPTVADLDHDGSTEIIVVHGGGHQGEARKGITVIGSESDAWTSSRQVWNQHAYSITNIEEDLGLPSPGVPNWPEHNTFRAGDLHPTSGGLSPDAVPLAEVCLEECGAGRVVVSVAVGNGGAGALRTGLPVSFYAGPEHAPTYLHTIWTEGVVGPGSAGLVVEVEIPSEWIGHEGLGIVVDDHAGVGYVPECHEDNNTLWIHEPLCP